jgi:hypothetical protein
LRRSLFTLLLGGTAAFLLLGSGGCLQDSRQIGLALSLPASDGFQRYDRFIVSLQSVADASLRDTLFDGKVTSQLLLENLLAPNWDAAPTLLHLAGYQDTLKTYSWSRLIATDQHVRLTAGQLAAEHFVLVGQNPLSSSSANAISMVLGPDETPILGFADASLGGRAVVLQWKVVLQRWEPLGREPLTTRAASNLQLAFDAKHAVLYAAVNDEADSNRVTVYQWEERKSIWTAVGVRGLTPTNTVQMGLALSPEGEPILAFKDDTREIKASVIRYFRNENQWNWVGEPGFTEGEVNYLSLAMNSEGIPYIGYYDEILNGRATVMRYNPQSKAWEGVGEAGFTPGRAVQSQIRFDANDQPHIIFIDGNQYPNTLSMMRFQEGKGWSKWPDSLLPPNPSISFSTQFSAHRAFHLAYTDNEASEKIMLWCWEPADGTWKKKGETTFSPTYAWDLSLALSASGKPWLAFTAGNQHQLYVMEWVTGP